jgi:hypothetical protein
MPTLMCTKTLWHTIGGRDQLLGRSREMSTRTRLADWSMGEFPTAVGLLAVALEETTYLTVLCPALELPGFLLAFAAALETALEDIGVSTSMAQAESHALVRNARFAKNDNRSLVGSVSDVGFHASVRLAESRITLPTIRRVQRELNGMPHVNREPAFPDQAIQLLFAHGASA